MRNVLSSHAEVAHIWASRSQVSGRSSDGRMYFERRDLFSYGSHYVLGHITSDLAPNAPGVVLLNSNSYSVSTGKHKSLTWRAVSHYTAHYVPDLTALVKILEQLGNPGQILDVTLPPYQYSDGTLAATPGQYRERTKAETRARDREALVDFVYMHPGTDPAAGAYILALGGVPSSAAVFARTVAKRAADDKAKADKAARELQRQNLGLASLALGTTAAGFAADLKATGCDIYIKRGGWRADDKPVARGALVDEVRDLRDAHKAAKAAGWSKARVARLWAMLKQARAEVARRIAICEVVEKNKSNRENIRLVREYLAKHNAGTLEGYLYNSAVSRIRSLLVSLPSASPMGEQRLLKLDAMALKAAEIGKSVMEREAAEREAAARVRRAEEAERAAATRAAWFAGEGVRFSGVDVDGRAFIRAVGVTRDASGAIDGGDLQTSQGAVVPLVHAVRAFRFLKLCHDKGEGWAANGRTLPVGHYKVSQIEPDGSFVAGCHRIGWAEVSRLAGELGIFDGPADASALVDTAHA